MKQKSQKNNRQILLFSIVGVINTTIDFCLLLLLKHLGMYPVVANIISTGVTFIISFLLNRNFVFKSTKNQLYREITLFVVFTLFGLWVLQSIVIATTSPLFNNLLPNADASLIFSKLCATLVSMTWNYITYDRFVFKNDKSKE